MLSPAPKNYSGASSAGNIARVPDSRPSLALCERIYDIPSEATGRIIGTKGVCLTYLRGSAGVARVSLRNTGAGNAERPLNHKVLRVSGTNEGVAKADAVIRFKLSTASKTLSNRSRKIHSWTLDPCGRMRTPAEVHKTGGLAPHVHATGIGENFHAARKQGKRYDLQKERAQGLRQHR